VLFDRQRTAAALARLAHDHQLFVGTSSWRFEGWCGLVYDEERYLWGSHFSKKRFHERCLEEYAALFPTVEVDSTYYALPRNDWLRELAGPVPPGFRFSFKVPDLITMRRFPRAAAFGDRAGRENAQFLDAGLFRMGFLRRLEAIREHVGALILEFSHFGADDFTHGREFVDRLEEFFSECPGDWQYAVEVRNASLLHPEHFAMLRRRGVAHVYNHWTRMPPVREQLALHPAEENPFIVSRFLLTPGRSFERAREKFAPFHQIREIDHSARESFACLVRHIVECGTSAPASYLYVGNDLEGCAPHTISDVLAQSGAA